MPKTLYLIDGHALAYRTYFALTAGGTASARWMTGDGEPTAGTYGFASVLLRYLEQDRPDYLMVAFDVGKTFRDDIFPDYKGTREKMPDDLRVQIERIREMVDTFNIPRLEREGYEADDVLGSISRVAAAEGLGVKIITGDRDLLQLVDERVLVSLPEGRSLSEARDYAVEDVVEKMGIRPDQVVDYKALVGDKSDNIPGVKGVGEVTAVKLLAKYDTLEAIYDNLEEIGGAAAKRLAAGEGNARLSQELARIVTDLDMELELDRAKIENFDPTRVLDLFRRLEFRSLTDRLQELAGSFGWQPAAPALKKGQLDMFGSPVEAGEAAPPISSIEMTVVDDDESLADLVRVLAGADVIAFDTETTGTDQMGVELVGISLSTAPGQGFYLPVGHDEGRQLPLETVIEALRPALTDPDIPKLAHNIKYDYIVLARCGLRVAPLSFDSMIAEWLINPASRNLGLKNLAWVRLNAEMTEIKELIGTGKKQVTMAQVPIEKAAAYAADDAEVVVRLMPLLQAEIEETGAGSLLNDIEMPLVEVLADMEMAGIRLDKDFLSQMSAELGEQIGRMSAQIFKKVGHEFNLNSTQQLSAALFERLGIEPPQGTRKTSSGHYSTAAGVLEALQDEHEIVGWILTYRELTKLRSTYIDALPDQVNPETGRVHTSYNQAGSVTGRIASSDPNLQNIPIRTELGRRIRKAFIADPGHRLLAVDYSQVELRVVAHMSDDEAMLAAFRAGQDIHAATAAAIYDIPLDKVDRNHRRHAKAINFGLIYGMSPFGLTRTTDLTLAEAENFVEAYFRQFPGVKDYLDGMRRLAAEQGYVETLLGRRRYFPGLQGGGSAVARAREEREAINAPIQGTAADILKIAMLQVPGRLRDAGLQARMLLQVHDELVFECPEDEVLETAALVRETMANAFTLKVPLLTEAKSGPNWYEMA